VLLVGSVVLVGCGGSDGDKETSKPTTVGSRTPGNDGGGAAEGSTGGLTESDCVAATTSLADIYGGTAQAMGNLNAGLRDQLAALEGYAEKAPSEVKADLRLVAQAFADFIESMANASVAAATTGVDPSPDTLARLRAATERIGSIEFMEASARVSAWLDLECGR